MQEIDEDSGWLLWIQKKNKHSYILVVLVDFMEFRDPSSGKTHYDSLLLALVLLSIILDN